MKNVLSGKLGGFTLIELLVVVLIIGILAAVALAQYEQAVWKSRLSTVKELTQTIAKAEGVYFLANGEYTYDLEALSIDMPTPTSFDTREDGYAFYHYSWGRCQISTSVKYVECILYKSGARFISYLISFPTLAAGCYAYGNSVLANKICQLDTHQKTGHGPNDEGITAYAY